MNFPDQAFLNRLNRQCQRLIEYYDNLPEDHPDKLDGYSTFNFTLSIGYTKFIYRSSFQVTYDGTLNIQNGCLQVSFGNEGYISHVDANSPAKRCIVRAGHPYLERGTKDIVTVLLTKFALNMPNKDGEDIYLQDAAKLPGTNTYLSAFNLVRGNDATYVKYGYESTGSYDQVKDVIRTTVFIDLSRDLQNMISQRLGREPYDDESLTELMARINIQNDYGLSDQVLEYICDEKGIHLGEGDSEGDLLYFIFDENQGFKNGWGNLVQILNYEDDWPDYEGGRRKKSRKQKAKTNKVRVSRNKFTRRSVLGRM
jgi:hypothetical protein